MIFSGFRIFHPPYQIQKLYDMKRSSNFLGLIITLLLGSYLSISGCNKDEFSGETGSVTDIDGNEYRTVKIGNQWWMAENLKTKHYRNGQPIILFPLSGYYEDSTSYYYTKYGVTEPYGNYYNWYAVIDSRNIAPDGWHVSTDEDWSILTDYLGGDSIAAEKLKDKNSWQGDPASNSSGFSALPGGVGAAPGTVSYEGYWWSPGDQAMWCRRELDRDYNIVFRIVGSSTTNVFLSVRCVKDY